MVRVGSCSRKESLRRNPNTKACSKANQTAVRSLMASVRSPVMTLILLKTIVAVYSRVTLMKRCYLFVSSDIQKKKRNLPAKLSLVVLILSLFTLANYHGIKSACALSLLIEDYKRQ